MSATERLRELLDERGVEYEKADGWWTSWETEGATSIGGVVYCEDLGEGLEIRWHIITPEQAVNATLGAGTCHDLGGTGAYDERVFNCSECGCVLSLYDRDGTNTLCTGFIYDYPRYCPACGARVRGDAE